MIRRTFWAMLALFGVGLSGQQAASAQVRQPDLENLLYIDIEAGRIVIEMRPDMAPKHVERIKLLARQGFYDGLIFHRVIEGFMAQGGDPKGNGTGGSDLPDLPLEISEMRHLRGSAAMARSGDPDSANSQFYICLRDCRFLDGQYTVWGRVLEGMRAVDAIALGEPPAEPTVMLKVRVAADVAEDPS